VKGRKRWKRNSFRRWLNLMVMLKKENVMVKVNWIGLLRDELTFEISQREREIFKIQAEISVYYDVINRVENVMEKIGKEEPKA